MHLVYFLSIERLSHSFLCAKNVWTIWLCLPVYRWSFGSSCNARTCM